MPCSIPANDPFGERLRPSVPDGRAGIQSRSDWAAPAATESPCCGAAPQTRMDRKEFYGRPSDLDEERLNKALADRYGRGAAALRERIAQETAAVPLPRSRGAKAEPARRQ